MTKPLSNLTKSYSDARFAYENECKNKASKIISKLIPKISKKAAQGRYCYWYDPWWFQFVKPDVVRSMKPQLEELGFTVTLKQHYDSSAVYLKIEGWDNENP